MDTLNLPERELLSAFRSTAKCYDAELEHYSPDDLARLGISLTEKGLLAIR